MKTNYQRVSDFNSAMGLCEPNRPAGTTSQAQRLLRNSLIHEEAIVERAEAQEAKDLVKIMDAHGDSLVVVYGEANDYKFNSDIVLAIVNTANMSKICKTADEAQESVLAYARGKHPDKMGKIVETHWDVVEQHGEDLFVVYDSKTGKGLKSVNFQPPEKHLGMYAYLLLNNHTDAQAILQQLLETADDAAMIHALEAMYEKLTNGQK